MNNSEIIKRIKGPTPSFFRKVRNTAILTGAVAGIMLSLPFAWPAWVTAALTLIVTVCSSVAGTSQLTTDENMKNQFITKSNNKNKWKRSKKL